MEKITAPDAGGNSNQANTITAFKTHHLWEGLSEEELLEERKKIEDWIILGKIKRADAQPTLDRLAERLLELEIERMQEHGDLSPREPTA